MKIVIAGSASRTRVFDNDGRDVTDSLRVSKIEISVTAPETTQAILYCDYPHIEYEDTLENVRLILSGKAA